MLLFNLLAYGFLTSNEQYHNHHCICRFARTVVIVIQ